MPKTFSALPHGGEGYLDVRSSHPDPARRYEIATSEPIRLGVKGLRELAAFLTDFADEIEPPKSKAKTPAAPAPAPKEEPDADPKTP